MFPLVVDDISSKGSKPNAKDAYLRCPLIFICIDEFSQDVDFRDNRQVDESMPAESVNTCVILVFPIKEANAMLQFCLQHQSQCELLVSLSFHWGSKPLVLEATTFRQNWF